MAVSNLEAMAERSHDISQGEIKHDPQLRAFLLQLPCSPMVFYLHLVTGWLGLQLLLLLRDPNNIFPFCPTTVSTACPNTAAVSISLPVHEPISSQQPSSFPVISPFTSSSLSSPLLAGTGWKKHQLSLVCGWPGRAAPVSRSLPGLAGGLPAQRG